MNERVGRSNAAHVVGGLEATKLLPGGEMRHVRASRLSTCAIHHARRQRNKTSESADNY